MKDFIPLNINLMFCKHLPRIKRYQKLKKIYDNK